VRKPVTTELRELRATARWSVAARDQPFVTKSALTRLDS
jgi:hypothetical protein